MKKYIIKYIEEIDKKIENKQITKEDIENHLIKISFFQHERLIHLIVTVFYAVFMFLSIILFLKEWLFVIITYLILIILLFYVKYYFFIENRTQYLYVQYDKMKELIKKTNK